ncbi:MAG: immunoglobulin domain-containing protein [Candidatus Kapabacteria bacterium]|nr:immunoglobulin domain-containing protein [Candidatus Kapabacteria bacterium]
MKRNTGFIKAMKLLLLGIILMPFLYSQSEAQYCDASTKYLYEYICEFYINDLANTDCDWSSGVADYTSMSTTLIAGKKYFAEVYNGDAWYNDRVSIWIDFNQDGVFDTSTEGVELKCDEGDGYYYRGDVSIPSNALEGSTRMRVRMTDTETPNPCGDATVGYGEVEDYTVNLVLPKADGLVTAMTTPVKPYLVGNYPVNVTLKSNNADLNLVSAKIDWWVNSVFQGTVSWTGNMSDGQTTNVNMGNFDFVYPQNEVNFDPFQMKFLVKDVNGKNPDADPGNDLYQVNTVPSLNDCGAIGFFGPPEGFGAGTTQVRARVMNYAPKPLSSVTVNWKVDGVTQTPKTFTGLSIKQNEYLDLNVGTYFFYNKTPLGAFAVEVWTELPNNVADENPSNDKYTGGIGPSLSAGVYFAGGANAHFGSPSEAASYLNSSGVFGLGTVIVEIRPGTYDGQIILNSPLSNNNPVIFRSQTGQAYDVTLTNSPNSVNNFVVQLANINNVTFENITIQNNNSNVSNAGRIVDARNLSGLTFRKMVFNGVANSPKAGAYNLVTLDNTTNVAITGTAFNMGSVGIWNTSNNSPVLNIDGNNFLNFSWHGIYNVLYSSLAGNSVVIQNNFLKTSGNPAGAIYSMNSTTISNNNIADIIGTGNANDGLINVIHTGPDANNTAWIENNSINNCSNINGIKVTSAYTIVNKNMIVMSQSANYGCAMIDISGSVGAVGNNMLMGSNIMAMDIDNSPMLDVVYNTASVEFNLNPVTRVTGASARIMRNIFKNNGTGTAIQAESSLNIDQNVLYTLGANIVNINGVNYADMAAVHNAGLMPASSAVNVEFFSPSDPHLKIYNAALLNTIPLFNIGTNWNGWYIESSDFDGENRMSYFSGADEIFLTITIERQTDGFVDCVGTTYNILTVSSAIGYNAPMNYQWELDGVAIPGADQPILYFPNLRHNQAGIYKCLVMGPGATLPVYSREVAVYVTRPTDITREPESHGVMVGTTATLMVEAHVNGVDLETALANGAVQVQWYRYVDEANDIPLVDNKWVSGSKSNYLTINKFRSSDVGTYYAVIIGLCGTVKTAKADLTEESNEVVIEQQPIDNADCAGKDVIFNVNASTPGTKLINYQWYKDGNAIIDNLPKIEGSQSKHLIIYAIDASDEGQYYAVASLEGTTVSKQSDLVTLNVNTKPVITEQPLDATVESGRQLMLSVTAQGNDVSEVLTYKWYKDGALVSTLTVPDYIVDVTTPDDAGDYYVVVSNDCGAVTSLMAAVVITTGTTDVIEVSKNGYSLSTAMPNPVQGNSVISFNVPVESYVKITLSDVSGAAHTVLTEGNFAIGTHLINLDAQAKNLVSGTYFYILEANGVRLAQKLVVIR